MAGSRLARERRRDSAGGFTLIELMAVMALISLLMGLGIGFMVNRGTDMDQALAAIRDCARLASVNAKSRGAPAELLVLRQEGRVPALQVRGLVPVGAWHLEPDERWLDPQLEGEIAGEFVAGGRFGQAIRPAVDKRLPVLRVATGGKPIFDLRGGFLLRLELWLDERAAATVAQLGRAFNLILDEGAVLELRLALAAAAGQQGASRTIRAAAPLPVRRWVTVDAGYDGGRCVLRVDGREVAAAALAGAPFQRQGDLLEVSPGQAPVPGLVDEIQLWAYELGEPVDLPRTVEIDGLPALVRFDARGDPPQPIRFTVTVGQQAERRTISTGGLLQ